MQAAQGVYQQRLNLGNLVVSGSGGLSNAASKSATLDVSRLSGNIFDDIKFIRLTAWRECRRSTVLDGHSSCAGQIYRRFKLKADSDVLLEFWSSGFPVGEEVLGRLAGVLAHEGKVKASSLITIADGLGMIGQRISEEINTNGTAAKGSSSSVCIDDAEVGNIHGKGVLAVWWRNHESQRSYLSIFILSDPKSGIREVHFSAASENIERYAAVIVETLRSFQWRQACPPPMAV